MEGARLAADVAEATGLTGRFGDAPAVLRQRRGGHDPGRVAVDLAVMLAGGGQAVTDLATLRDQAQLFGPVASDPTAWRLLSKVDGAARPEPGTHHAHTQPNHPAKINPGPNNLDRQLAKDWG